MTLKIEVKEVNKIKMRSLYVHENNKRTNVYFILYKICI